MKRLEISGNVLRATSDLLPFMAHEFEAKVQELLATGSPEVVIDLSGVREIASVFLASMVQACVSAASSRKRVTIRVPKRLRSFFDFADAEKNVVVEAVEDPPRRPSGEGAEED